MKKIVNILILCFMICQATLAGQVTEEQARQMALRFLKGRQLIDAQPARQKTRSQNDDKPFYVFNAADNGGYVIVSGDDRTKDILAFSDEGNLDEKCLPDNMKWWLGYYERSIKGLGAQTRSTRAVTRTARNPIEPLIKTKWSQEAPFNNDCPEIGTGKCLTGCLATAMAQVMNYWHWPDTVGTMPGYDPYSDGLFGPSQKELPRTEFDWVAIAKDTKDNAFRSEVAKLCHYCGQSVRMGYATDNLGGSSALDGMGVVGLVKYFQYDAGTRSVFRESFADSVWEAMIYNELANERPVIYSGQTEPINGGKPYGHTFICDGYQEVEGTGYYHINWGWGSQTVNSWCLLSVLDSKRVAPFTEDQSAVIGIQPLTEQEANHKQLALTKFDLLQSPIITRESVGDEFPPIYFSWVIKNTVVEKTVAEIDFVIERDQNMVDLIQGGFEIRPGWHISNPEAQLPTRAMTADGVYRCYPSYWISDTPKGLKTVEGCNYRYIEITVEGLKMTLKAYPVELLQGDADGDGAVTMADRDIILAAIAAGLYDKKCDANTDGKVTVADIVALYDILENNNN